ncbi:MAG: hypothetical protein DCF16_00635 [Alphaproteobacteria bacterium]|nr:MAG: hypothetical protein DCF16_00635 [Alphaproteobacteria bacterium]
MGLRLVARLYDRSEALVMSSCLDAAGVPHFLFGAEMININPLHEIVYDGYKIIVCDDDLASSLAVLAEAQARPAECDEVLTTRHFPVTFAVFHLAQFLLVGLIFWIPMRRHSWLTAAGR